MTLKTDQLAIKWHNALLLLYVDKGSGHIGLQTWGLWRFLQLSEIQTLGGVSDDVVGPELGKSDFREIMESTIKKNKKQKNDCEIRRSSENAAFPIPF